MQKTIVPRLSGYLKYRGLFSGFLKLVGTNPKKRKILINTTDRSF